MSLKDDQDQSSYEDSSSRRCSAKNRRKRKRTIKTTSSEESEEEDNVDETKIKQQKKGRKPRKHWLRYLAGYVSITKADCMPNGIKLIECHICGAEMGKIYELRSHFKKHTNPDDYDLKALRSSTIYELLNPQGLDIETSALRDFIISEIKEKRYSQFYSILNEAGVELHISDSETDADVEPAAKKYITKKTYKCELCPNELVLKRRYLALLHQQEAHANCSLPYVCDDCGDQFISVQLFIRHLKTLCECDEYPINCIDRFREYLAKINLEQFERLAQAREEIKQHRLKNAEKTYTCNTCGKTFMRSEHLARHKSVHLPDELKIICLICHKKFSRKDTLDEHIKVHLDEAERDTNDNQAILCQYCGFYCDSKSKYVLHMRRHTGDKPYCCDICSKSFAKSTDLHAHKMIHSNESNFRCTICNKDFSCASVLSKHVSRHTAAFSCTFCDLSFQRPNDLTEHLRLHAANTTDEGFTVYNC